LHCLDLVRRRVVWTYGLPQPFPRAPSSAGRRAVAIAFRPWSSLLTSAGILERSRATGGVIFVGSRHVFVRARRELIALDARSGEPVWRLDGLRPQTRVLATDRIVYLLPPQKEKTVALRAEDGQPLTAPNLAESLARAVHMSGFELTVLTNENVKAGASGGLLQLRAVLKRLDVRNGRARWQRSFGWNDLAALLDRRHLCLLAPDGGVQRVDLVSGTCETLDALSLGPPQPETAERPESEPSSDGNRSASKGAALLHAATDRYLVADPDQFYIVVNHRQSTFFAQPLPSVRTHGYLFAYDRQTGRRLWSQPIEQQAMILERFDLSPYLVFAVQKPKQDGKLSYRSLALLFVDKRDGRRVLETQIPTYYSNFTSADISLAEQYVELRTYNERLRIVASPAPGKPPAE